jgi:hypothetical protein
MAPAKHTSNSNAMPVAISVSLFTMEAFFVAALSFVSCLSFA